MARSITPLLTATLLSFALSASPTLAQQVQPGPTWSQEDTLRIVREVQKQLSSLSDYSVFDWITFGIHGKTIVLKGYASRPILKEEAGRVVKKIEGIESVDNQIEVLPLSPNDDRIRAAVYNRIYTQPALRKYNANQGSLAQAMGPGGRSFGLMAGGITNNPPIGFHAIHIIVNNGHVTLYGVVLNNSDAAIAGMQANSAPGAFSVDNDLIVQGSKPNAGPK
ncbi:MAG TPA: BON domain-containing protein [Edaphobacter sp.]|nr:BON domain-containing protein [Edaphobacter sp.]